MGSLPLRQSEAARRTKIALGAAALAGAGAVILFLLPKPRVEIDPRALEPVETTGERDRPRSHPTRDLGPQQWTSLADSAKLMEQAQPELAQWRANLERARLAREEAMASETPADAGETASSRGGGFPPSWRYIAQMDAGGVPMAIISVGERQRLVAAGFSLDDYTIERITPEKLIITKGRSIHEIKRGETTRGTTLTGVTDSMSDPGVFAEDPFGANRRPAQRPRNNPR